MAASILLGNNGHERAPGFGADRAASLTAGRISATPEIEQQIARIGSAGRVTARQDVGKDELAKGQEKPAAEPAVAAVVAPKAAEPDLAQQQAQKAAALMSQVASDYGQHVKRMLSASGIDTRGMSLDGQTDALQQVARQGGVGGTMMDVPEMPANGFVPMEVAAARPAQGAEMARG